MVKLVFIYFFFIELPLSKKELKLLSVSLLQLCVDLSKFSVVFYKTFKDFSKCGDYSRRKLIRYFQYNLIFIIFNKRHLQRIEKN